MSRNPKVNYSQYVHEYTARDGSTRFAVGEWVEAAGEYQCPHDKRDIELTGCTASFAKKLQGLPYTYRSRVRALRRARYLFGQLQQEG